MIVNDRDVSELTRYLEEFREWEATDCLEGDPDETSVRFFAERPHLLLPVGFDETRCILNPDEADWYDPDDEDDAWAFRAIEEAERVQSSDGIIGGIDFTFEMEYLYRKLSSGTWYWFNGLMNDQLHFHGPASDPKQVISTTELLRVLSRIRDTPDMVHRSLWLPKFWTPSIQQEVRLVLTEKVGGLLRQIAAEKKSLRSLSPRLLEEIVAELLRERGMDVYVTPETRDGGRDVILRGELIPGEPLTLAVEVKQKAVVGIDDVQRALKANEDFPALLLATAGRFSAGVIAERLRKRHELRLFLKDGVALSQWIEAYANRRFWRPSNHPIHTER